MIPFLTLTISRKVFPVFRVTLFADISAYPAASVSDKTRITPVSMVLDNRDDLGATRSRNFEVSPETDWAVNWLGQLRAQLSVKRRSIARVGQIVRYPCITDRMS